MSLSDEEINQIAGQLVQDILKKIGAPIYVEPDSVSQALEASMHEEKTAADFYRRRAQYADSQGDEISAELWRHTADDEDQHYQEFHDRLHNRFEEQHTIFPKVNSSD